MKKEYINKLLLIGFIILGMISLIIYFSIIHSQSTKIFEKIKKLKVNEIDKIELYKGNFEGEKYKYFFLLSFIEENDITQLHDCIKTIEQIYFNHPNIKKNFRLKIYGHNNLNYEIKIYYADNYYYHNLLLIVIGDNHYSSGKLYDFFKEKGLLDDYVNNGKRPE